VKRWFRDWWRGWSDEDRKSYLRKVAAAEPGMAYPVTMGEMRAGLAHSRENA
jgi:hypothetical protein